MRGGIQLNYRPYPPIFIPPVKEMPKLPRESNNQFSLSEGLKKGTLFKWLYDPYNK